MFKSKAEQPKNINFEQLVIGSFWSGKTMNKTIFSESLSIEERKNIANEYENLVRENAELTHFKEIALKHITKDQLEAIKEEMKHIPG